MQELENLINLAFDKPEPKHKELVAAALAGLSDGSLRIAEKVDNTWIVHQWLKKAVLLHFKLNENTLIEGGATNFFDKVALKYANFGAEDFKAHQVRIVPPAYVRNGSYIAPNCVIMPSYINIGAYIDRGSMVDIWATIGSCAQIGKNVHISSNTCIGGVLEPMQANPVIIEDNCFVGTGCAVVEGVIVEENSILGMGVKIGQSTKIYDRATGEISYGRIPAGSVAVPGSIPSSDGKYQVDCVIIIKKVDARTRSKVAINELLREN